MIRLDGYYIYEPILYKERTEHTSNYLNMAYLFKKNGFVIKINKWSNEEENLLFKKDDFDKDFGEYRYEINENEMYLTDKRENNGYKFYYDIISKDKIKYRETGQIMKFIPWEK